MESSSRLEVSVFLASVADRASGVSAKKKRDAVFFLAAPSPCAVHLHELWTRVGQSRDEEWFIAPSSDEESNTNRRRL
jgi:hypothetical protein